MRTSVIVLVSSVFLASAVESVEALTIVLAVGVSRGWRSALEGAGAAVGVLAVLVAVLGPVLERVPLGPLRVVVGGFLLLIGLQWLRKAVLRASGFKAKHDEDAIFAAEVEALTVRVGSQGGTTGDDQSDRRESKGASAAQRRSDDHPPLDHHSHGRRPDSRSGARSRDGLAFVTAFKGVFLEGLEVIVLVLTLGANAHRVGIAAAAAGAAVLVVAAVGLVVSRQLSGVPENALKMVVGVMLVSLGTFWSGEGVGVHWPGSDLAIPVLVGFFAVMSWIGSSVLGRLHGVRVRGA